MCAHATYVRLSIRRFAPAKLISGYCCGIIVFAFHLSCLHICLHPSFSFRLTRLQIELAIRPPFSDARLPSSFLSSPLLLSLYLVRESDVFNCLIKLYMRFLLRYINYYWRRKIIVTILYSLNYLYIIRRLQITTATKWLLDRKK